MGADKFETSILFLFVKKTTNQELLLTFIKDS